MNVIRYIHLYGSFPLSSICEGTDARRHRVCVGFHTVLAHVGLQGQRFFPSGKKEKMTARYGGHAQRDTTVKRRSDVNTGQLHQDTGGKA